MAAPLSGCSERVRYRRVSRRAEEVLEARPCRLSLTRRRPGQSAHLRRTNRRTAAHDTAILIRLLR